MDRFSNHFNPAPPLVLHLDVNSCFATIEQQANPLLRGRPIVVATHTSDNGRILTPSIEAKWFGCQTGTKVKDCRRLCPEIIVIPSDPHKYRYVHQEIKKLLQEYSDLVFPRSIDEFILDLQGAPALTKYSPQEIAHQIKRRIQDQIGSYLTVSIGIAPNRTLAKLAANLDKPNGLRVIHQDNYHQIYQQINLTDLPGINSGYQSRLNRHGVYTVPQMFSRSQTDLHQDFNSVVGQDWFARLRGWEVDHLPDHRRSFSNTFALPTPLLHHHHIFPILTNLAWKASFRMRVAGFYTHQISLSLGYQRGGWQTKYYRSQQPLISSTAIIEQLQSLFWQLPRHYVTNIDVGIHQLVSNAQLQLTWLDHPQKQHSLYQAIDLIEHNFGRNTIFPARMTPAQKTIPNRISFSHPSHPGG